MRVWDTVLERKEHASKSWLSAGRLDGGDRPFRERMHRPRRVLAQWFQGGAELPRAPQAPTEQHWIDADDARVRQDPTDLVQWWTVFHDPVLDRLIECAAGQNLTLREAGFRILEARAQLGIAEGNFFPQEQTATVGYQKTVNSGANPQTYTVNGSVAGGFTPTGGPFVPGTVSGQGPLALTPPITTEGLNAGLNLAWEVDFWGRFRRAIVAAEDTLEANCAEYNGAMVTLLGDVAKYYVQLRTDQTADRVDAGE